MLVGGEIRQLVLHQLYTFPICRAHIVTINVQRVADGIMWIFVSLRLCLDRVGVWANFQECTWRKSVILTTAFGGGGS